MRVGRIRREADLPGVHRRVHGSGLPVASIVTFRCGGEMREPRLGRRADSGQSMKRRTVIKSELPDGSANAGEVVRTHQRAMVELAC